MVETFETVGGTTPPPKWYSTSSMPLGNNELHFQWQSRTNFFGKFKLPEPENVSNNRETLKGTETGSSEVLKSLEQHRFCRI